MKPITDDDVFSILKGLEKHEKRRKAVQQIRKTSMPDKVLGALAARPVITLASARQRAKRTVSGMYCFVARSG